MKKYSTKDLKKSLLVMDIYTGTEFLNDMKIKVKAELLKREKPFVKATDDYIKSLKDDEVERRPMKKTDDYYVNGFYGLFEKSTGKLLRRHSDTGLLPSPFSLNNPHRFL